MLNFGGLNEGDRAELARSWIDEETAAAAHLARIDDEGGRAIFGGDKQAARAGLLFPYFALAADSNEIRGYRVRRDKPETERRPDGTTRPLAKYLAVKGSTNMLYVPPDARRWLHSDVPMIVIEGEKKCLAAWRLARHGQAPDAAPRWVPLAISGVWNWRGRVGDSQDEETGEVHAVKGPIQDWFQLDLEGRKVVVVFDADVRTNQNIRIAREKLAAFLVEDRRAEVSLLDIPKSAKVKGFDDWLAAAGPDAVLGEWQPRAFKESSSKTRAGDLLSDVTLFRTRTREAYASVPVEGHVEIMPVESRDFYNLIVRRFMARNGEVPGDEALTKAIRQCNAAASAAPPTEQVFVRLGSLDQTAGFSLDLGGPRWEAVNVSRDGWRIGRPACKFQRSTAMLELPRPVPGGTWEMLRPLVNSIDRENFILMTAWLIGALAPFGPYPILMISGEKGSAKSTTAENLRRIVDPVEAGRRSLPDDERSLLIEAMNTRVVSFDNLSGLSRKVSDWLCRISTGGGSSQRRLHSNNEQVILSAMRPMVLNGIVDLGTYPDLLSRGLAVELPKLPESARMAERDIEALFLQSWPRLLGLLLDAAAAALKHLGDVELKEVPRMADFTRWVVAACHGGAMPFAAEEFLEAYELNRKTAFADTMEAAPFPRAVQRFMEDCPVFEGTAEQLRLALVERLGKEVDRYKWAHSNQAIGNELKDMADVIRVSGYEVERFREPGGQRRRLVRIRQVSVAQPTTLPAVGVI